MTDEIDGLCARLRRRKAFGLNGTWMMLNEPDQDCIEAADALERLAAEKATPHNARLSAIEECARELETRYPDHAWLNAACAAIRALSVTPADGKTP